MAYVPFDGSLPDVAAGSRTAEITAARTNLTALMDLLAQLGNGYFFDISITASTADGPTTILYTNGTQIVKKVVTYGSGVTAGLPVTVVLSKSTNSGGAYSSIATITIAYDGSGNFLTTTWS